MEDAHADLTHAAAARLADALALETDLHELHLALRFTRLTRLHAGALEELTRSIGLTTAEAVVLTALAAAGPDHVLSPTALQGMVVQTPGGVTKTLRRLERAGLVERRTDLRDRRALLASLTVEGFAQARAVNEASAAFHHTLFARLAGGSLAGFAEATGAMLAELEARSGARASGSVPSSVD